METVHAVVAPGDSVASVVERLREIVRDTLITYGFVVDETGEFVGVLIFRDLLFAESDQRVEEVMIRDPDWLDAEADVETAMRVAVLRHYPEYPVVDRRRHLVGLIRGQTLFEQHAFQLSAQAGQMVGVEQDERLATPWRRSLRFRQPWLQLNLLTAFAAGAVVALFQDTIDQIVLLAAFLPVVAGQTGNTGSQALAVTVRSMTLGELTPERARGATLKEMLLGTLNGAAVGLTAGAAMYFYAASQEHPAPALLAIVVFLTMVIGCMVSGVSGTLVPRLLRKLGADPATASSILLTTATDVVSMGVLLMLAGLFVL
jgi:magnesium transporter